MSYAIRYERFKWFDRQVRAGRYPNARLLAEKFETSKKTAKRQISFMKDRLRAPLEYVAHRHGYVYEDQSFELPRIPVTQEELLSILIARRLLSKTAGGLISDAIHRFGEKLMAEAGISGKDQARFQECFSASWHGHSPVSGDVFQSVYSALLDNRPLKIVYQKLTPDEPTPRVVEPHHLRYYMGSWVLFAWCRLRNAWRIFFLARIQSLQVLAEKFTPHSFRTWKAELDKGFGLYHSGNHEHVVLRFNPRRARLIQEQVWHEAQTRQELPDGGVRLSFPVADFSEVKMMILSFGADVVVEAPDALRRAVEEEIQRMARVYCQPH